MLPASDQNMNVHTHISTLVYRPIFITLQFRTL